ncbi:hypothetical protein CK510_15470 [Brunnivagina elsteri CCALA 953]|uniref:Phytanoyl-CoA dioxygenase n=2 Tax=Brunnivagina TaxID=3344733 RepID=A0A2A2TID8_9CYAN|nr:hypothetical protein CK510_15470 [Calothrix elsteri CCALA 953]
MRNIGRFHIIRNAIKKYLIQRHKLEFSEFLEKLESQKSHIFLEIRVEEIIKSLDGEGIFQGLNLPEYMVKDILEFALTTNCYGENKYKFGFKFHQLEKAEQYYKRKFLTARYYNLTQECPGIKELENDSLLIEIAARYLRTKSLHIGTALVWNFPVNFQFEQYSVSESSYHYDLDGYNFIKFFFYLTDVNLNSGPHVYVRGSHKNKTLIDQFLRGRTSEQHLINYYGQDNIIKICAPAGWGFVEDTFASHQGVRPINQPRLMLQLLFATHDYNLEHNDVNPSLLQAISFEDE